GAAAVITSKKSLAQQPVAEGDTYDPSDPSQNPQEPPVCSPRPENSPPTRPFVHELPIPPAARPTSFLFPIPTEHANVFFGEAPRAPHQRWREFLPRRLYNVRVRPGLHRFHPDIPPSYVWGFNGIVP